MPCTAGLGWHVTVQPCWLCFLHRVGGPAGPNLPSHSSPPGLPPFLQGRPNDWTNLIRGLNAVGGMLLDDRCFDVPLTHVEATAAKLRAAGHPRAALFLEEVAKTVEVTRTVRAAGQRPTSPAAAVGGQPAPHTPRCWPRPGHPNAPSTTLALVPPAPDPCRCWRRG